ncbi:hypothetical protein [Mycolicibacterium sp. PDY-3]|uniref:hypothetical protein n=1 Tax=Mycolicibacterium sp. PDY-3 TaxID=3376069 RepID=UPI0037AFEE74
MMTAEQERAEAIYDRNTYRGPLPERSSPPTPVKPTRHPRAGHAPGVRSTSRNALATVKLGDDERVVFNVLKMHDRSLCDSELLTYCRKYTDKGERWKINQINGRRFGLLQKGLIEEDARWQCDNSVVPVIHWKVVEVEV